MKKNLILIILIICFLVNKKGKAQSDNLCPQLSVPTLTVNSCTGATSYNVASTFTVDLPASVASGSTCITAGNNVRDGWFKFVASSSSSIITATIAQNNRNFGLVAYTGLCAAMTEVGCVNAAGNGGTETLTLATTSGTTYYIRIVRITSGGGDITGTISIRKTISNDNCATAINLTPGILGGACTTTCASVYGATASSPSSTCAGTSNDDVWFSFTASQAMHTVTVAGSTNFDAVVEILSGTCGALTSRACADYTATGASESITLSSFISGTVYYIRVYDYYTGIPSTTEFTICVTTPVMPTCPVSLGTGVVNILSLPYTSTGRTTTGKVDDINSSNTLICGGSQYYSGPDEVFVFTPTATGSIGITLTSTSSNVGIMLYDGCPFVNQGGVCIDNSQSTSGNQVMCANVISGHTYYLIVDRNSTGAILSYNITITAPATTAPVGSNCSNPVLISTLPYSISNQTTLCKGNDYNNGSSGSCASLYESGEDMVFRYSTTGNECIRVDLSNTSSTQAGFQVYENCPGGVGASCLGFLGGGNVSGSFSLPGAGTYYIVVDSWDPPEGITFNLSVTSAGAGPSNDLPCNATPLTLGINANGTNSCAYGTGEPAAASCWTSGELNTVWYTVIPTSTSIKIKTFLGTLANTQIALYQGACGSLTQVTPTSSSCNLDIYCGSNSVKNSEIYVTGLTAGTTYYVRVDGENDRTGSFGIMAIDGATSWPSAFGQECAQPLPVCANSIYVGDPGFSAFGNTCEFGTFMNCLLSGERASAWYTIPVLADGTLEFDIVPNDWLGAPSTVATDYDFAIWEIGQSGLQCSQLATTAPVRCNYSALGVTGLSGTGNSPGNYPGFNAAYESALPVLNGQTYLLMVSNFTNSTSGFTMNFVSAPDPINYSVVPPLMTWQGGTNSSWTISANWGACAIPNCAADAIVQPNSINQPTVTGSQTVKNMTIESGSSLTINTGATLSVCGNFINNGSLYMMTGSTIRFVGTMDQTITGNFTGVNKFANFVMDKASGQLILNDNIDIYESDSLKAGLFNQNGKTIRIKQNFYNSNGSLTHLSPSTGTYEFTGNSAQSYINLNSDITLNNVIINQTSPSSITLGSGANNNMIIAGSLTLTQGKIVTGNNEVTILNTSNTAITTGNTSSYVEGNLRRYLTNGATGTFDFPVGHATPGYELAKINFTTPTQIPNLLAKFTPWTTVPNGPSSSECSTSNYSLSPVLNHGYWTIDASANANTGTYNITLNNRSYNNNVGTGTFTVMKQSPAGSGPWVLDGTCSGSSTVSTSQRLGLNGFSNFATAQYASPLPITLLYFSAEGISWQVNCTWETVSEINNDYFIVERSKDGRAFEEIGTVDGAGNSNNSIKYFFTDKSPIEGISYYRLRQIDFDGTTDVSDIVAVRFDRKADEMVIIPNPASEFIQCTFTLPFDCNADLQISNVSGQKFYSCKYLLSKGMNTIKLNVSNLSPGFYNITVKNDECPEPINMVSKFLKK